MERFKQMEKEALTAIKEINEELFKKNKNKGSLSVTISDDYLAINFHPTWVAPVILPQIHIWDSENDDRIYYEKSDKYETFYKLIKRKFLLIKRQLNDIKL